MPDMAHTGCLLLPYTRNLTVFLHMSLTKKCWPHRQLDSPRISSHRVQVAVMRIQLLYIFPCKKRFVQQRFYCAQSIFLLLYCISRRYKRKIYNSKRRRQLEPTKQSAKEHRHQQQGVVLLLLLLQRYHFPPPIFTHAHLQEEEKRDDEEQRGADRICSQTFFHSGIASFLFFCPSFFPFNCIRRSTSGHRFIIRDAAPCACNV